MWLMWDVSNILINKFLFQGNKFMILILNISPLLLLLEINPCEPNPCQHNGRCSDFNGIATCECEERYSGDKCQSMLMILLHLFCTLIIDTWKLWNFPKFFLFLECFERFIEICLQTSKIIPSQRHI